VTIDHISDIVLKPDVDLLEAQIPMCLHILLNYVQNAALSQSVSIDSPLRVLFSSLGLTL
jgi:hypothetical protein